MSGFKIGEASAGGGNFVKKEWTKFKSGMSLVVRVLPPMGDLAEKGIWSKYYAIHFGYRGTDGKMLVFQSTFNKDRESGEILVGDAALDRIEALKAKKEKLDKALEALPEDDARRPGIEAQALENKELLETFNVEKKYYMNVIDLAGKISALPLGYKEFNALKELRKTLQDEEQIDLVSPGTGIFLSLSKTGRGFDTSFSITPYLETTVVDGKKVKSYKELPITEDMYAKLERESHDLGNLYPAVTPEQIEAMVNEGAVAVDVVKKLLRPDRTAAAATAAAPKAAPVTAKAAAPKASAIVPKAQAKVEEVEAVLSIDEDEIPEELVPAVKAAVVAKASSGAKATSKPATAKVIAAAPADDIDDILAGLE